MTSNAFAEAERLGRRRARMLPGFAAIFVTQQAIFFTSDAPDRLRTVDMVKTGGWLALTLVLLAALWTGGFWFKSREVRALMDDEVTRAHRAQALSLGFLAAMLAAVALYLTTLFAPVDSRTVLHAILSIGLATALLRFGLLERRAHRG